MRKPVIIIGAGMAGLTTAAYLSRAGLKVDVYEQHTLPGGYISSFIRDEFTCPHGIRAGLAGGRENELGRSGWPVNWLWKNLYRLESCEKDT